MRYFGFLLLVLPLGHQESLAFDSGSTGADGPLTPNVDAVLALPDDGIFNFSEIDIPSGVTVRFEANALNTPVILLVSGDATIDGVIDISGETAAPSVGAGDGNIGDDGLPGSGGPGGFAGGRGGDADPSTDNNGPRTAQSGLGPGGGIAVADDLNDSNCLGSGGSFAGIGEISTLCRTRIFADPYGNTDLLPLVGGSGGSGGHGSTSGVGSGGGGGGGALLLAVTGTLTINGQILADGGRGGDLGVNSGQTDFGTVGGGGSGGGIRLVATTIDGNGAISARGAQAGAFSNFQSTRADGGAGRIRLEAENLLYTESTVPPFSSSEPGELFVAGMPALRITSVAGQPVPNNPTGNADVLLPSDTPNPVELVLETTNVPVGNTLTVIVTPPRGTPVSTVSTALQGTEASATATASVDLAVGGSVLLATLSFAVDDPQQQIALSRYTDGEPVVFVEVAAGMGGRARTLLHTRSGKITEVEGSAI